LGANRTFSPVRKNLAEPTLRKCNENNARLPAKYRML
jgi:hypothetical protein